MSYDRTGNISYDDIYNQIETKLLHLILVPANALITTLPTEYNSSWLSKTQGVPPNTEPSSQRI